MEKSHNSSSKKSSFTITTAAISSEGSPSPTRVSNLRFTKSEESSTNDYVVTNNTTATTRKRQFQEIFDSANNLIDSLSHQVNSKLENCSNKIERIENKIQLVRSSDGCPLNDCELYQEVGAKVDDEEDQIGDEKEKERVTDNEGEEKEEEFEVERKQDVNSR